MSTTLEPDTDAGLPDLSPAARRDFAVIIPAYDEADNAADLVRELRATFERHPLEGEDVDEDDGQRDGTAGAELRAAARVDPQGVAPHRLNIRKAEQLATGDV